ncbi:Abi family protein [Curvibacter sp. RS43]|uniref:Abi family protein n=1 Tax=Curvibacter microcysteis TaxID=3026419 RepID=UPI00235E7A7A|nr:Abi family protein [Curvibacter sp. RS43]MDD0811041.1 Abi family protein [Curvibacter sp. RS43]
MVQPYAKPWLSVADQLQQLIDRGMLVTDEPKAEACLKRIGYYRLSGYWFAFRERSGPCSVWHPSVIGKPKQVRTARIPLEAFKPGARFEDAVDLYVFDKRLRLLTMDALERIEVALRVDISHTLGQSDPFAYLKPELFHASFATELDQRSGLTRHHEWLTKHAGLVSRSKEEFMRHNKEKYGLPVPIWVACEVWDFGTLSTLYGGMKEADQDHIAQGYGLSNGRTFATWLRSLNYVRNVCAHHSRLWNRNIVDQPKLPPVAEVPALAGFHGDAHRLARPFLLLCMIQHLMLRINPSSTWGSRLKALLLNQFPPLDHLGLNLLGLGVDPGWEARPW